MSYLHSKISLAHLIQVTQDRRPSFLPTCGTISQLYNKEKLGWEHRERILPLQSFAVSWKRIPTKIVEITQRSRRQMLPHNSERLAMHLPLSRASARRRGSARSLERSRHIAAALRETMPHDLRRARALRRLTPTAAMLYRCGEWGSYESSNSTAIFVRRLYLRFSRRYRAGAARGLAFWLKRRSGGPVLVIVIILRSSAARV